MEKTGVTVEDLPTSVLPTDEIDIKKYSSLNIHINDIRIAKKLDKLKHHFNWNAQVCFKCTSISKSVCQKRKYKNKN